MRAYASSLLGALTLVGGCHESDIDPMMRQEKFKPYWENDFYSDGPRHAHAAGQHRAARASARRALTPPPVTAALVQRGRERFDIHCAVCHGYAGDGDSVVASKMSLRATADAHRRQGARLHRRRRSSTS